MKGAGGGEESEAVNFKRRQYVRVTDVTSEMEESIGVVEEFMRPDGTTSERHSAGCQVIVYFPLDRDEQRRLKLTGVNTFHGASRQELKRFNGLKAFDPGDLELVDPEEL